MSIDLPVIGSVIASGGSAKYVCDPLGYVHTDSNTGDGSPTKLMFTNIPQDYEYLLLRVALHRGSSASQTPKLYFNNDVSSANYKGRCEYQNSYGSYSVSNITSYFYYAFCSNFPSSSQTSANVNAQILIFNYADSNTPTAVKIHGGGMYHRQSSVDQRIHWDFNGEWDNTAAVTEIDLENTDYWGQNTNMNLLGIRSA